MSSPPPPSRPTTPGPPRTEEHDQTGRVLGSRYRLVSPVGSGASARVYLARDMTLGRKVAVKCLRPGLGDDKRFLRRFGAEARAAAQLSHPNLLAVYDWGEDGDTAYIVTEILLGGSLRAMLDRWAPLSPSQGLLVALQLAEGLAYAHQLGWVHRDIKPANVLFGEEGRLRIADFGIARALAEASLTEPEGVLVGTARYAAPEQTDTDRIDGKADVYSLALTVVEAVTGRVPLLRDNALATLLLRRERNLGNLRRLGPLGPPLAAAGRADPDERPTAGELVGQLSRAARSLPPPRRLPLVGSLENLRTDPGPGELDRTLLDLTEPHPERTEPDPRRGGRGRPEPSDDGGGGGAIDLDPAGGGPPGLRYRPIPRPAPLEIVRALPTATSGSMPKIPASISSDTRPFPTVGDDRPDDVTPTSDPTPQGRSRADGTDGDPVSEPTTETADPPVSDDPATDGPDGIGAAGRGGGGRRGAPLAERSAAGRRAGPGTDRAEIPDPPDPADSSAGSDPPPGDATVEAGSGIDGDGTDAGFVVRTGAVAGNGDGDELPPVARHRASGYGKPSRSRRGAGSGSRRGDRHGSGGGQEDDDDWADALASGSPARLRELFGPPSPDADPVRTRIRGVPTATAPDHDDGTGQAQDGPHRHRPSRGRSRADADRPRARGTSGATATYPSPGRGASSSDEVAPTAPTVDQFRPDRRVLGAVGAMVLAVLVAVLVITSGGPEPEPAPLAPAPPAVDDLVGATLTDAEEEAATNGWILDKRETRRDGTRLGQVLEQEPAAGERLPEGSRLEVLVSLGPELRTVPALIGRDVDEVQEIVEEANLSVGAVTRRHDDVAPTGDVLAVRVQGAEPGTRLETATPVDLVISAGPPARPLPSLVGLDDDTAEQQLDDLGLEVVWTEDYSETFDEGLVIDHRPQTGSPVRQGDEITVVRSLGPPLVEVPDVRGQSAAAAADLLLDEGFVVIDTIGPPNQVVLSTDPAGGEKVPIGSSVTIRTSNG